MLIPEDACARVHPSFSFQDAVFDSLKNELDDAILDTAPTPTASDLREDVRQLDNGPYGARLAPPPPAASSFVATPAPAPRHELSPGGDPYQLEHTIFGGDSPPSSAPSSRPPSPTKNSKKRSQNKRAKAKRARKRRKGREEDPSQKRDPAAHSKRTHIDPAEAKAVEFTPEDIPSTKQGYVAKLDKSGGGVYTLPELLAMGFELVKWDGSTAKPIVDSDGRVLAVLVGKPKDSEWQGVHDEAFRLLRENAARCNFTRQCMQHRRGNFAALNSGISFGGGPQAPGNVGNTPARTKVLKELVESPAFIRLAGFASSALGTWMPRLHRRYDACLDALVRRHSHLTPNFTDSAWAAAAFNFGPKTVTDRHRDAANLPYGVCSVTALGKFNYVKGGHAVLWEFNLVVEFPPGSTILIPSAAVTHSNTPIGEDEERCSFTQYSAGGLFRWVDQGFQKKDKYMASLSKEERDKQPELDKARCAQGVSFFSTLKELRATPKASAPPTPSSPPHAV